MKKVVKFGGTSCASAEQFKKIKDILASDISRRFVVVSAPGKRFGSDIKVTDMLYAAYDKAEKDQDFSEDIKAIKARYDEIIDGLEVELDLTEDFNIISTNFAAKAGKDYVASRGEYLNGKVASAYFGFPFIDSADVIRFNEDGSYNPDKTNDLLSNRLNGMDSCVLPGFYGAKEDGSVKTFSRGGSDISGSILAKAIKADIYENWTDVSGFLVTDPRIVENPQVIKCITYRELRELAYMGASVLHEDAIFPVRSEGIPINIRNTNAPQDEGTMIVESTCNKSEYTITGIAGKKGFVAVYIEKDMMNSEIGFGRRVLQAFEDNDISFEHMPSGIDTMTIIVHQSEFEAKEQQVLSEIHRLVHPDTVELVTDLALIAVVGRGMRQNRGTAGRIFSALAHAHINVQMIDQGSSELNIIIGVANKDFDNAIKAIYDIFVTTQL